MRRGKQFNIFSEPLFHFIVTLIGLALIVFLPDSDDICDGYKKIVSVASDIGIGLFPTGLIGLILVFIQKNQKDNEKFDKRLTLLKELDIKLRNYLNEICRSYVSSSNSSENIVKKILGLIIDHNTTMILDESLKESAESLSIEIEQFLNNRTNYLLTEIFDERELEAFSLLTKSLDDFTTAYIENSSQAVRDFKSNVISLLKLLKLFSEFEPYLKSSFSGSHIQ